MLQVLEGLLQGGDAAVDGDGEIRVILFDPVDAGIVERRDLAVLLGAQTAQPGLAGMDDEGIATGVAHLLDEGLQKFIGVLIVDADAGLHRHRNVDQVAHRLDAVGHQCGLSHQAGAEAAILYPIGGAANVDIHLVIATLLGQLGAACEIGRIAATQLQGDGMFLLAVPQVIPLAVNDGAGGHHLGIEQGLASHQTMEITAMPIGPVQHGGDGKTLRLHKNHPGWLNKGADFTTT